MAALLRRRRKRTFACVGIAVGVPALALCCALFAAPLLAPPDIPEAGYAGPVGPEPPKENPRPPESALSFGGASVAVPPTFWCKNVRATAFCRGEELLPVPPEGEALREPAGSTLGFVFGGPGTPRPARKGPGGAPVYVGAERLGEGEKTRPGPGGVRYLPPEPGRGTPLKDLEARHAGNGGGDRFLVEAALPPGEYVLRVVARTPSVEPWYHFRVRVAPDPDRG